MFGREKIKIPKRLSRAKIYKCRLCGVQYSVEVPVNYRYDNTDLIRDHLCSDGKEGIADLQGVITAYSETEKELI